MKARVAQILIEEGAEGVKVNTPILILAAEGESVADAAKAQPAAASQPPQATAAKADVPNAEASARQSRRRSMRPAVIAAPRRRAGMDRQDRRT